MVKKYSAENIRNVVILGHAGAGKSTLMDSLLYTYGTIAKIGSHADGSLVSDFDVEEKKKKMSVHTSLAYIETEGVKLNIIDCPGHADLVGERRAAVQAADAAILVLDSVDGVQVGTEKAWRILSEMNVPRIIFVNKMDQDRASYEGVLANLENTLHANLVVTAVPVGAAGTFSGVIDIIEKKFVRPKAANSREEQKEEIPANLADHVHEQRLKTVELAAEGDDALIEMFLEGKDFDPEQIYLGIRQQIRKNRLHPVVCGSALKAVGIRSLVSLIVKFMPSPAEKKNFRAFDLSKNGEECYPVSDPAAPVAAVVWKTYFDQFSGKFTFVRVLAGEIKPDTELLNTDCNEYEKIGKTYTMIGKDLVECDGIGCGDIGVLVKLESTTTIHTLCDESRRLKIPLINLPSPVFGYSISAANKKDDDKLGQILHRYSEQYPTIHYTYNPETRQSTVYGMGQLHLDIILDEIMEKYKIEMVTGVPRISYRETITTGAEAQYKHKKQSGGHGQYGEVYLRLHPLARGAGFQFAESIVGGSIPRNYIPAVEKGVIEALDEGVIARYPVTDVKAEVFDGSYHPVDSSEMAFKIASQAAFRKAMESAKPVLLEPIMNVTIFVDKQYLGDVMGDITSRRGRVTGMETKDETSEEGITMIKAQVPHAEMLRYAIDVTSLTQNKAVFEMEFSHYDPISGKVAENVIAERTKMLAE